MMETIMDQLSPYVKYWPYFLCTVFTSWDLNYLDGVCLTIAIARIFSAATKRAGIGTFTK